MSPMVPMTERSDNLPSVNVHQMMGPATPMTPVINFIEFDICS